MKKNVLLFIVMLIMIVFLVSCGGGIIPENQFGIFVTNWNAGPGVANATVRVFESGTLKIIGNGVTNENGGVVIKLIEKPEKIDISVVKEGHARSFVSGLKSTAAVNNLFPVILQTALLEEDPTKETDPIVVLQRQPLAFESVQEKKRFDETITEPFEVVVNVEADRDVMVIYKPLLDQIPGSASVTSNSQLIKRKDTASFEISPTGFNGEVALYTTVYDDNNNRVVKVEYLSIQGKDPGEVQMYQPMPFVDFTDFVADYTLENIRSFTRMDGLELRNEGRVAPSETNLWTQLYWADWTSLNSYYGSESLLPDPGEQPDGYNLYCSGDGKSYQKFAFIPESSVANVAAMISESVNWMNKDRIANTNVMGLDGSFHIFSGYPIYYRVTSVYGTLESTPTDLGSVTPLAPFEVVLDNPLHETTVNTLTPTFQWQPSKALTSDEGTPEYYYGLYLKQLGAPTNEILACVNTLSSFFNFRTNQAEQISVTFTGNVQNLDWGCLWKWYNEDTDTYRIYDSEELLNNTSYEWYVPLAYAVVNDDDSKAYSIASDYKYEDASWGIDPFGGFPFGDRNRFETVVE